MSPAELRPHDRAAARGGRLLHRLRQLPQLDGLVFTGGIGENSALIRSRTITHLKLLNLALDEPANARTVRGAAGPIQADGHPRVLVVPTNEERQIALDTLALLEA